MWCLNCYVAQGIMWNACKTVFALLTRFLRTHAAHGYRITCHDEHFICAVYFVMHFTLTLSPCLTCPFLALCPFTSVSIGGHGLGKQLAGLDWSLLSPFLKIGSILLLISKWIILLVDLAIKCCNLGVNSCCITGLGSLAVNRSFSIFASNMF